MNSFSRRNFVALAVSASAGSLAGSVWADAFPNRPIRLVVPYAPGGGADMVARTVAQRLTETLGWSVVVDNRAGANGMIGADNVAKSAADGYTLLLTDAAHATNPAVQPKVPFDPIKDFAPLTLIGSSPQLLVANPSYAANSLKELLAMPQEQVRGAGVGTTGPGSVAHLLLESLKLKSGVDLVHVPYKGGSAALTDAVGGQIPLVINSVPACMPHVEAKRLKVLAIASPSRHPKLPQVQTFTESASGIVGSAWYGVLAPAKTPPDVLRQLSAALEKTLDLPDVKAKLAGAFIDPMPAGPQAFAKFLGEEIARWQSVAKQTGITVNS